MLKGALAGLVAVVFVLATAAPRAEYRQPDMAALSALQEPIASWTALDDAQCRHKLSKRHRCLPMARPRAAVADLGIAARKVQSWAIHADLEPAMELGRDKLDGSHLAPHLCSSFCSIYAATRRMRI
jgi:hypothetical protein